VVVIGVDGVGVKDTTVVVAQWAVPLASAPHGINPSRVCGESCSTTIVGLCAPVTPLYLCGAARRGTHCYTLQAPPTKAQTELVSQFRRHFQREEITFLTFFPLISTSYLNSTILLFINQCTGHTAS
jgi:hypothetical protein